MTGTATRRKEAAARVLSTEHIFTDQRHGGTSTDTFRCDSAVCWKEVDGALHATISLDFASGQDTGGGLSFSSEEPGDYQSGEWVRLGEHIELMVETHYHGRDRRVEVHWRWKGETEEHRLLYHIVPNAKAEPNPEEHVEVILDGRFQIHWMMPRMD